MTRSAMALFAFNRLLVALLCIAGLFLAVELIVTPEGALAVATSELVLVRAIPATSLMSVGALVGAISLLILLLELSVGRERQIFEAHVDGGTVEYAAPVVAAAIERELDGIDGVQSSRVSVHGRQQRVDVQVRLTTYPDDDAQAAATRASNRIHDKVASLGLEVGQLRLVVQPSPKRRSTPAEPKQSVAAS